ncbi:type VI secretion system-associated FHA domain protein TagH [Pseudomonas aeruginosa]|nr:type VI secretion system-associated FHA domain protein TagH [Pseudomonas aeruginosa]MBW6060724.1 type VI secretion system-associated FHA domain protein TagH [Pseudomonas aeruginosa]MBW6193387.1 type VI secretion system-associated FHA domain protein TagH [Pseudomonas aeruginosa]
MPLRLTITSYHKLTPGQCSEKVLDQGQLTIGRGPDNDWVLPDPERLVSSRHCTILNRDGVYYLTDTSTNGVLLVNAGHRLRRGNSEPLQDGETVRLGEYDILVQLGHDIALPGSGNPQTDPFTSFDALMSRQAAGSAPAFAEPAPTPHPAVTAHFQGGSPLDTKPDLFDFLTPPPPGAAPSILDGAAMLEAGLGLEDLVAAYAMVFMAAFETTISMVGNATLALLTHPDQLDLLRRCPELAANAVEELLRFDGAVRGGVRCTLEEVEIGGQRIPPGEKVWLSFLAANRDPEMFAAPDRLQLQRANAKQHVAFAHGPHYCLGAYLARLELQCALRGLVRRRFALASEPTDLRWRRSSVFRTLERLPIVPEGDAQKTCE